MWTRLYSEEHLLDRLRPALEVLKEKGLRVGRAWAIEESLRQLVGLRPSRLGAALRSALVRVGGAFPPRAGENA